MSTLVALFLAFAPQSADLARLENVNPEIRLLSVRLAGEEKWITAVHRLIKRLEASDEKPEIKAAAQTALVAITKKDGLKDAAAWRSWWDSEGSVRFPEASFSPDEMASRIKEDIAKDMTKAKQDVRGIAVILAVSIFLFIIVMFFFVGHVSSKIKGWRELVGRAEIYVKHGQELTQRIDKFGAELDAKKAEVAATMDKLRSELEEGIARRGDDLGTELTHQLRTELQTLRQKAERELDQTVTDLKTQVEAAARRAAAEVRDRLAK